jgi:hypothetical protein
VLTGHAATAAADVYAFGLVLWELLAWRLPWGTRSPFQVGEAVQLGTRVGDEACLRHTVGACLLAATTACGTDTPAHPRASLQVRRFVLDGGRPEVPPVDALPGGAPPADVLDAYCQLMRWVGLMLWVVCGKGGLTSSQTTSWCSSRAAAAWR